MANKNEPLREATLKFIRDLPALALTRIRREPSGRFTATLDLGPKRQVGDACPIGRGGATPQEAADAMKDWLLDDLMCLGKLGKRHYQPHWDNYEVTYRLGDYWKAKLQELPAIEAQLQLLQEQRTSQPCPQALEYEGWTNSATYLANLYMTQSCVLYGSIVRLFQKRNLTGQQLKRLVSVVVNKTDSEACGYSLGWVRLDEWAQGPINWDEMADNWKSELAPFLNTKTEQTALQAI